MPAFKAGTPGNLQVVRSSKCLGTLKLKFPNDCKLIKKFGNSLKVGKLNN